MSSIFQASGAISLRTSPLGGPEEGFALTRIESSAGIDLCYAAYDRREREAAGLKTDALQAFVRLAPKGVDTLYLAGGRKLEAGGGYIGRASQGSLTRSGRQMAPTRSATLRRPRGRLRSGCRALSARRLLWSASRGKYPTCRDNCRGPMARFPSGWTRRVECDWRRVAPAHPICPFSLFARTRQTNAGSHELELRRAGGDHGRRHSGEQEAVPGRIRDRNSGCAARGMLQHGREILRLAHVVVEVRK